MKPYLAEASRTIEAPPERLWPTIARMTGMENWYPGLIARSDVQTTAAQPTRHCVMQGGGELHERILVRDEATRTFVYAIDSHPLPARNVVGTIRIDPVEGGSHVVWEARFMAEADDGPRLIETIAGMYRDGLDSLATYHTA